MKDNDDNFEIVKIDNEDIPVIEWNGQRVVTTSLLAKVYGTDENNVKSNFNRNKNNFVEGKHYYLLQGDELKDFKRHVTQSNLPFDESLKFVSHLYLWTQRGANRHCKILDTDKAWEQFDNLEDVYFNVKNYLFDIPKDYPSALRFAADQYEKREIAEKKNKILTAENDILAQKNIEWLERPSINAMVRRYATSVGNNYGKAWNDFKKELLYKYSINLNLRITNYINTHGKKPKTLDELEDFELPYASSTIVSLCRENGVNIDDILEKMVTKTS